MAAPTYRSVALNLTDPTLGVQRAGALFDKAFASVRNIADDATETRQANVAAQTEANTQSAIAELQKNKNLDNQDEVAQRVMSGLATKYDGDINTGGVDMAKVNAANAMHRQTLFDERADNKDLEVANQGLKAGELDMKLTGSKLKTEDLAQQMKALEIKAQPDLSAAELQTQTTRQATNRAQTNLAELQTRIATSNFDDAEKAKEYEIGLGEIFNSLPSLSGAKPVNAKEFAQTVNKFRALAIKAGVPSAQIEQYMKNTGIIDSRTGKTGTAQLVASTKVKMTELKAEEDALRAKMSDPAYQGSPNADYSQDVIERVKQITSDPDLTNESFFGISGGEVMPKFASILGELNKTLPENTQNKYSWLDVKNGLDSVEFDENDLIFSEGGTFSADSMKKATAQAYKDRMKRINTLRESLTLNRKTQANFSQQLLDAEFSVFNSQALK